MNEVQRIRPAPVVKEVRVKASADQAFSVFAEDFGKWWPKSHSVNSSPMANAVVEPRAGGRFYEIGEDGSECEWGVVREYVPCERLVIGWKLDADWQFDADFEVPVTVTFTPDGDHTLVRLEHGDLQRYGERAAEVAKSVASDGGWPGLLAAYAALVDRD